MRRRVRDDKGNRVRLRRVEPEIDCPVCYHPLYKCKLDENKAKCIKCNYMGIINEIV